MLASKAAPGCFSHWLLCSGQESTGVRQPNFRLIKLLILTGATNITTQSVTISMFSTGAALGNIFIGAIGSVRGTGQMMVVLIKEKRLIGAT